MINDRKKVLYCLFVILLNVAITLLTIANIINWTSIDNIIFLFVFSKCLWVISLVALILHTKNLFDRFYKMMTPYVRDAEPEFFSTSQYLLPKNRAYNKLKYITIILLFLVLILETVLLIIK